MIRLGVATRVLGNGRRRAGRGPRHTAHLSLRLLELRDTLAYLADQQVGCYRLPSDLAGAGGVEALEEQLAECGGLAAEVGGAARTAGIRLTMHLSVHGGLAAEGDAAAARAAGEAVAAAALLEALGCGPEGTLVLHIGGSRADGAAALHRFAARYERLPGPARARVAVEPGEDSFSFQDALRLHQLSGAPVVFDALHHQLNGCGGPGLAEALGLALATWPPGVRPKAHFSTQRTEAHVLSERGQGRLLPPRPGQHADFLNPFEFAAFARAARGLPPFDVVLEAKAGDLALLRLREDLRRYAPDVAASVW